MHIFLLVKSYQLNMTIYALMYLATSVTRSSEIALNDRKEGIVPDSSKLLFNSL